MVEIGGRPILWHIMKHYSHYGFTDFVIALGYKGDAIKRFVFDEMNLEGDVTLDFRTRSTVARGAPLDRQWRVDLVETGLWTLTGGRIKRLRDYLGDSTFMLTWGDGLSDVDLGALLEFHRSHGKLATVTVVRAPRQRFGRIVLEGDRVADFREKPENTQEWINGAFFVLEPEVLEFIEGDATLWETEPMERLVREGQLMAFRHESFWQCMDTIWEKNRLEELWQCGEAPWKVWS